MERMLITTLTPDEVRQMMYESAIQAVRFCLKTEPPISENVPNEAAAPFVSKREAGRLLGVCTSSVDNAARRGDLTRCYVGKSVRFDRAQVLALARSHITNKKNSINER